jgi:hypothetical protein
VPCDVGGLRELQEGEPGATIDETEYPWGEFAPLREAEERAEAEARQGERWGGPPRFGVRLKGTLPLPY